MQGAVDRMSKACDNLQLTISTKKTEAVYKPAPGKPYSEPTITVNGQKLQVVDKFTKLVSTLSIAVHLDDDSLMRLQSELRRPAYRLADFTQMSGNEMESGLILS